YYRGGYAEIIQRSMSTQSWAYPEGATDYVAKDGTSYSYDSTGYEIQELLNSVLAEGYWEEGGIYTNGRDKLNYTFTIAGGSTDHPAYQMFLEAAQLLNSLKGIHVNVVTSQTALTDLTSGKLTVWAAAWTSTIDPDMYQVYHKDSTAASVKNWGYDYIMADKDLYAYEWAQIQTLSGLIDSARTTTVQDTRKNYYRSALDLVMELAVEFPTYQRKDLFAYDADLLQEKTMQSGNDLTPYNGPLARIWEVNYK
ncbi:MAG: hypothetical protein K2H43_03075, partial [Clostridia bacterium]|nr:hypothetical protein [Clostridia bacterium]